jgi:autotransporter passenger strand-loop-strand repeat protein
MSTGVIVGPGNSPYHVSAGQTDTSDVVVSGGTMDVDSGGTARQTTVSAGGEEFIASGGVASGTVVSSGGTEIVDPGGVATHTVISGGGIESVYGVASGTVVRGGKEFVQSGGVASAAVVSSGGIEQVFFGGTADGATVKAGGTATIGPNGKLMLQGAAIEAGTIALNATRFESTTLVIAAPGATLNGTVNLSNSSRNIITGTAPSAILTNNGTISGAGQIGLTLVNMNIIDASEGSALRIGAIGAGYSLVNKGVLEATGTGGLIVFGALTGHGTAEIFSSSQMEFESSVNNNVTFENNSGNSGVLILGSAQSFRGTLAGFAQGDSIDLANFHFSRNPTISNVTGSGAAGTDTDVTVTDGAMSAVLKLVNATAGEFPVDASAYSLTADSNTHPGTLFQLAAPHA